MDQFDQEYDRKLSPVYSFTTDLDAPNDDSARNDIAWCRRRVYGSPLDKILSYDFPFVLYFPQNSIRSHEFSNDVIIEQAAAEEADVQHSGALA